MKIKLIASILIIQLFLLQTAFAQQRGVGVRVRNEQTNKDEEVQLYNGSYALIIGVSDYTNGWKSLPGVKSDVIAVSAALKTNGFNVRELVNPTRNQLTNGIDSFINDYGYETGNRLLIYFAGHGHTQKSGDGRDLGYIVPTDAPLPNKNDILFRRTALSMNEIDNYARRIEAKHALFVFDSCFSGSLLTKRRSNVPPIITLKTTQPVRQFITAGADDQEVPDVSIFRRQFVEGLDGEADLNRDGYITGSELADFLQEKVGNYTRLSQTPQYGKIFDPLLDKGDFVFTINKGGISTQDQIAANEPIRNTPANNVSNDPLAELEAWNKVKNGTTAVEFQSFLQQFPNGVFANQARAKMNEIGDPEWNQVKTSKDATVYRDYINKNPSSPFVELARERMKTLAESMIAWEQIKDSKNRQDFEKFVKDFPDSSHFKEANKRLLIGKQYDFSSYSYDFDGKDGYMYLTFIEEQGTAKIKIAISDKKKTRFESTLSIDELNLINIINDYELCYTSKRYSCPYPSWRGKVVTKFRLGINSSAFPDQPTDTISDKYVITNAQGLTLQSFIGLKNKYIDNYWFNSPENVKMFFEDLQIFSDEKIQILKIEKKK